MLAYRTGQYVNNASMDAEDQNCINLIHLAIDEMRMLEKLDISEKNFYHFLGLQGFKRLHRYQARERLEKSMALECLLVDHYGVEPEFREVVFTPCEKRTILDRLQSYAERLESSLGKMNDIKTQLVLANHHFSATFIQEIIDCLECNLKYAYRHLNYVKDIGGQVKDIHWYSHEIHECYKEKEKNHHGREFC